MTHLLQIDTSPRIARSVSRLLSQEFVEQWMVTNPGSVVTYRDIGKHHVPHITEEWMESTKLLGDELMVSDLFLSNELVDELFLASRYLISVPIHNFTIPSTLKTYIDHIVRIGLTVAVNQHSSQGLLKNKKMLVIATYSNNYRRENPDVVIKNFESYLKHIFGFIGVEDVNFIYAYNQSDSFIDSQPGITEARKDIRNFISHFI
jgi:FMN-dependent NADH-azoreductase